MATDPQTLLSDSTCLQCSLTSGLMAIAETGVTGTVAQQVIDSGGLPSAQCPIPTGLTTTWNAGTNQLDITWDTPPAGIVDTEISYSTNGLPFVKVAFLIAAPGTSYSLGGFTAGDQVCVRIRAHCTAGISFYTASVCLTVPTLLKGLTGLWKFDESGGSGVNRLDSIDSADWIPSALGGTFSGPVGVINNSFLMPAVNGGATNSTSANFNIGAGVSFTVALWFSPNGDPNGIPIVGKWHTSNDALRDFWLGASAANANPRLTVRQTDNTTVTVTATAAFRANPLWNFLACGFDAALQEIWIEFNGGTRVTQACTSVRATAALATLGKFDGGVTYIAGRWDEMGLWKRSLSASEVATLYQVGSGLAYPWSGSRGSQVAANWSAQVVANGGATPSGTTVAALETLVDDIVGAGFWMEKVIALNPIAPDSLIAATTPIYQNSNNAIAPTGNQPWTNNGFVAGDLSVNGLQGDGTSYMNTGINTQNLFANNGSFTIYVVSGNNNIERELGSWAPTTGFSLMLNGGNAIYDHSYAAAAGRISDAQALFSGYLSGSRVANNDQRLYKARSNFAHAQIGATNVNVVADERVTINKVFYFMANNNNGVTQNPSTKLVSFVLIGKGLTAAESQALFSAVQAFRQTLGGGFV